MSVLCNEKLFWQRPTLRLVVPTASEGLITKPRREVQSDERKLRLNESVWSLGPLPRSPVSCPLENQFHFSLYFLVSHAGKLAYVGCLVGAAQLKTTDL